MLNTKQIKSKSLTIYYTVCQYVPDPIRQERLNLGLVVQVPALKFSKFYYHEQKKRLAAFDPNNDLSFMQIALESFIELFNADESDNDPLFANVTQADFLPSRTKYFVNCFCFLPVTKCHIKPQQLNDTISWLQKTYL